MTKQEIKERVYECKNDEDIKKLIEERIKELEIDTDITVGQNYTDSFNEFISDKVHYKSTALKNVDLVYDDLEPYILLIKSIQGSKKFNTYNELTLFRTISYVIHNYLPNPNPDDDFSRAETYFEKRKNGKVSIKDIKNNQCAFCSEKSGLAHNMFKILGIDSSLIVGRRNDEAHAYNIIYPKGYDNKIAVLYDASHWIECENNKNEKSWFGFFKILTEEEIQRLKNRDNITFNNSASIKKIKDYYGYDGSLDGFEFKQENVTYSIGLGKTILEQKNAELTEEENKKKLLDKIELKDKKYASID